MKKIVFTAAAIAVLGFGISEMPLKNQMAVHASTMACAQLRGDQTAWTQATFFHNANGDIKLPLAMPTLSAEVAESIRQSGGC